MLRSKLGAFITILFLLLAYFNIIHIVRAEGEPISISLDCYYESCKGQTMNYSNNILLELTIKNNLDYWASIGGGTSGTNLHLDLYNNKLYNNGRDSDIPFGFFAQSILIKPRDELKVYIPFEIYNNKIKDDRIGDWRISPKLFFNTIGYYQNPLDSYTISTAPIINSPITGNDLKFNVEKPETSVQKETGSKVTNQDFWENPVNKNITFPTISQIIAALIIAAFSLIAVKFFKRTKKRK